jgi:DNA helicase-2/ATP-dependent DNA helicase PcrA
VISQDDLLTDLTDAQRRAVTHVDGPLLIVAGAGSGKTRVITRRVAYLISMGIPANGVLAITFTNKAAGEMKHRIGALSSRPIRDFGKLDQPWPMVCTFHSLCLRILRHYAVHIGLPNNFSIFDSADQTKLIKEALKTLDISSTNFSPSQVHGTISNAKNQLLSAEAFSSRAKDFYERQVARIFTKYQALLKQNNALDFDDLLLRTTDVLRDHPDILRELQDRFQYILIDEYQDTNHAQYILAHALAQRHKNICVVGDPDQSIYAWRGADIKNILEFERDYPDATVVRLEQNYRSTKTILEIASKLISSNTQRKDKSLWTENSQGEPATVILAQDEHDEAQQVTKILQDLHEKQKVDWNQMAIFYRMNALSRVMEDALRRASVPYQIARGVEFYNRREIKDTLAYLRVIANPDDEVSLARIINVPTRGIGDSTVKQLQARAVATGTSLWGALQQANQVQGLSTRALNSIKTFITLINTWRAKVSPPSSPSPGSPGEGRVRALPEQPTSSTSPRDPLPLPYPGAGEGAGLPFDSSLIPHPSSLSSPPPSIRDLMEDVVVKSGMEAALRKEDPGGEAENRPLDNVNELISSAAEFDEENPEGTLDDYLSAVSLVSDADHLKGAGGAITLMTLHAAKGLEFPIVAMIGLEEGVLPHARSRGNLYELEEERRLCFVGITRAEQKLIMTKANYRTIRGLRERTITSPFLTELPQDRLEIIDRTGLDDFTDTRSQYREKLETEADRLATQFAKGQLVRHPTFGLGRIADLSNMGQQTRAVVDFNAAGRKTLILQYARLEPVP